MATLFVGTGYPYDNTELQDAIDDSVSGDVLKLKSGDTFTGTFTLRNKGTLADYITITTDSSEGSLPEPGHRTSPSYVALMPTIVSAGSGASTFITESGANHWKLQHLHLPNVPQGFNSIVRIGINDSTQQYRSEQPDYITVDQCYLHGHVTAGQKRAFELHGKHITISNNYVKDIKSEGQDSQSIQGCNGEGPYVITNNYFSAGTTPILFGGSDPNIRTRMTITSGATTTSANVSCSDAGHTLSELQVGQLIAVLVSGTYQFSNLTTISGTGSTGSLIWSPALTGTPDNPGSIKAGIVLGDRMTGGEPGLLFRYNHVKNDPDWINKTLDTPTNVSATPSTSSGTLGAGTYYYKVQAFTSEGYQGNYTWGDMSSEANATLGATGKITVTYTTDPNATVNRIWRSNTGSGNQDEWVDSFSSPFVDDGSHSWNSSGTFGGRSWQIKNLFEIKAAQNCQIDSNIFEYVWRGSDVGFAWWIKTVNQESDQVWAKTKDVVIEKNIIRHCYGWLEVHGRERGSGGYPLPAPLDGLTIRNNLVYDSNGDWGQGQDSKYCIDLTEAAHHVTIDHNTLIHTSGNGFMSMRSGVETCTLPVITNNMGLRLAFGIHDNDGTFGEGSATLSNCSTGGTYTFQGNAIADAPGGSYPSNNYFDSSATWEAQFTIYVPDGDGADFLIIPASTYFQAGTDGKDIGADIGLVLSATATVESGLPPGGGEETAARLSLMYALSGVLRSGAGRSGFFPPFGAVSIAGITRSSVVVKSSVVITDEINDVPNTARMTVRGSSMYRPQKGQEVVIGLGNLTNRIFAGHVLNVTQQPILLQGAALFDLNCVDYSWQLDWTRVKAKAWSNASVTTIFSDIVSTFAPGFSVRVEEGLATIDFQSNHDERVSEALSRLMKTAGGYWYVDYDRIVHGFVVPETDANPTTLNANNSNFWNFSYSEDLSQTRPRVRVLGGSTTTTSTVSVGATSIPVNDTRLFGAFGGSALTGANQITYTGKSVASGPGSLTGVPASGAGAVMTAIAQGDSVRVLAISSNASAAAAVAALVGTGDGYIEHSVEDGQLGDLAARQRAAGELLLHKNPDKRITYNTRDLFARSGKSIAVDLADPVTGQTFVGTFTLQRVVISDIELTEALFPTRAVEAGLNNQNVFVALGGLLGS